MTPCPLHLSKIEIRQEEINAKYGRNFEKPVVYYDQFISGASTRSTADGYLNGQIITARKLEEIAAK